MVVQLFPPRHVYFPSSPVHTCTVILLHDTNSTGAELAAELAASTSTAGKSIFEHFPSCRWVFPSAQPRQTDTCHASPGNWIDIDTVANADADAVSPQQAQPSPSAAKDKDKDEDEELEACVEYMLQIVEEEVGRLAGDSRRVVLGGFGQGMAVAAATLIAARRRLGAFVGVSGWVPVPLAGRIEGLGGRGRLAEDEARMGGSEGLSEEDGVEVDAEAEEVGLSSAPQDGSAGSLFETPVLLTYVEDDPYVDIRTGLMAYETLSRLGFVKVVWDPRPGPQQGENWLLDSSQVDTIVDFLAEVFGHEGQHLCS